MLETQKRFAALLARFADVDSVPNHKICPRCCLKSCKAWVGNKLVQETETAQKRLWNKAAFSAAAAAAGTAADARGCVWQLPLHKWCSGV